MHGGEMNYGWKEVQRSPPEKQDHKTVAELSRLVQINYPVDVLTIRARHDAEPVEQIFNCDFFTLTRPAAGGWRTLWLFVRWGGWNARLDALT